MSDDDLDLLEPSGPDDGFAGLPGTQRIDRLLREEMGPEMARGYARAREVEERWMRRRHPDEGLRERKKRLTRQQISDVATTLFIVRGFDRVTVAQVAEIVGVSEKTVYNYFPTKESLVFDKVDEGSERLAKALRERSAGESPTRVILAELADQSRELEELPDETHLLLPLFAEMVVSTPALRAAWLELQDRLTELLTRELAEHADVDPRDPEPQIAASALIGLTSISYTSRRRHVEDGLRGAALSSAVSADLERAARLLDTGLWSFSLMTEGARSRSQLHEAALAAEETREQVVEALKQARTTWRKLRGQTKQETRQQREQIKLEVKAHASAARDEAKRAAKAQAAQAREEIKRAAKAQAAVVREEALRATRAQVAVAREEAKRAASTARNSSRRRRQPDSGYADFRRTMAERHEAIRQRETPTSPGEAHPPAPPDQRD